MGTSAKAGQLQIRVSADQKAAIRRAARRAGLGMSAYVLGRVLSVPAEQFAARVAACAEPGSPRFALADLNSLLTAFTASELREAVLAPPAVDLTPFLANYIAAMVEFACARRGIALPAWVHTVMPLNEPVFGSTLESLRFHLLTHSPAPFRRRNLFIDATVGQQV